MNAFQFVVHILKEMNNRIEYDWDGGKGGDARAENLVTSQEKNVPSREQKAQSPFEGPEILQKRKGGQCCQVTANRAG